MDVKVAWQAFAVVPETAPAEEALGVEGTLRRAAQKLVPVDRPLAGVGWDRIHPGAARVVAVDPGLDGRHLPESAARVDLPGLGEYDPAAALAAYLHDAVVLFRRARHGEAFLDRVRHGLFAIDVLAGGAGVFHDLRVPVVRRGDDHEVHVLAVENGAVVLGGRKLFPGDLLRGGQAAVIKVADRHHLRARAGKRRLQVFAPAHSCADGREPQRVARRDGGSGGAESARFEQRHLGGGARRRSPRSKTDKVAPGQRVAGSVLFHGSCPPFEVWHGLDTLSVPKRSAQEKCFFKGKIRAASARRTSARRRECVQFRRRLRFLKLSPPIQRNSSFGAGESDAAKEAGENVNNL